MPGTLYERLGGRKGIEAIAHAAVDNHLKSPLVAARFRATDLDRAKRMATQFFCMGSGGPERYEGKDMRTAHLGMNVNEQEYMAVMDDIVAAMTSHGVAAPVQGEVVAILFSLKGDILRI
jgi:hemoglobin